MFGKMVDLQKQFESINELDTVFNYFKQAIEINTKINTRICSMNCNQHKKVEITSDIFAIEQSYSTQKSEKLFFESHIKYVDVQFLISGREVIEVVHIDLLEVDSEYNGEGDYSLYKATPNSSKIIMRSGDLSVFFPKDGHMPGIQYGEESDVIHKTVVKIPLTLIS